MTLLVDHDIEGQAFILWGAITSQGWPQVLDLQLATFQDIGLAVRTDDRQVWRLAQSRGMILLTANRNRKGENSLERAIQEECTARSLPVVTIGNPDRVYTKEYREDCVERLLEIIVDLDNYLGVGRLFIP